MQAKDTEPSVIQSPANGPHAYMEKCAEIERLFMKMATNGTDDGGPWTVLTSLSKPYPITVEGHAVKQFCFRITFYAPASPATAFDLLANVLRRPEWDELTDTTEVVQGLGHGDSINYVKMKAIWPTAARDSLLISHIVRRDEGFLNVGQSIEDSRVPEKQAEGIVRMEAAMAGQLVTKVSRDDRTRLGLEGENWCKVVQIADGDMKGWIPKSVIRFIATQAFPKSLTKVCKQLAMTPSSNESLLLRNLWATPVSKRMEDLSPSSVDEKPVAPKAVIASSRMATATPVGAVVHVRKARWVVWARLILRYATPAIIAALTTPIMQFFLDDSSVPIRLFSASNAPHQGPQQQPPTTRQQQPRRSVPGFPYIQFNDDEYDGSYPFDAFQDLRSAYGSSPLASLQSRLRLVQQQRAQAQLQRLLLEQQMHEHVQRERELRRYQMALEQQRQAHTRAAAEQARRAYLGRLAKEEQERQVRARGDAFSPPFHFFNRILENQLKSQDDVERRRAQKVALGGMLDAYFGQAQESEKQAKGVTPVERTPSPLSLAGVQQPQKGADFSLEPGVLDNVLRVVHDRLNEIAAEEAEEKAEKTAPVASAPPQTPPRPQPTRSADDAAGAVPEQKGVEIEEPIDYGKLANILRGRVNTLNDVNVFVPRSPPLEQLAAFATPPPPAEREVKLASPAMDVDSEIVGAEHTDSEFAGMMNECKAQLKELKDTTAATQPQGKRRQRRRHHRPRHRAHHHDDKPQVDESMFFPAESVAADMAVPEQVEAAAAQKQAVNTIEDYILGARNARKAQAAMSSLRQLHDIELELDAIREQYNRQLHDTQLSFVADKSGNLKLAFNQGNKPFLMYQDVLQKLLYKLDEVPSGGDEIVRAKRKAVVVKIQDTLDALDRFAADQESELTESGSALADESSNAE
ncbi:hypothetical protein GGI17_000288 [Coemansia sp. S146]|nr:hypothetical protein GGI17_000288 [Coemansia sp. S146]